MANKSLIPIVSLIILGIASQAKAGGLYLYEIGTEDLGLASAGTAARAQDASTVASNPAGMTRLDGKQLTLGPRFCMGISPTKWTATIWKDQEMWSVATGNKYLLQPQHQR